MDTPNPVHTSAVTADTTSHRFMAIVFQDIKDTGAMIDLHDPSAKKMALLSALTMYVDFVNLFFFILAILVKRKQAITNN